MRKFYSKQTITIIICIFMGMPLCGCSRQGCCPFSLGQTTFNPKLGVCASVDNAEFLKSTGYDYVEEGVGRYLIPAESDEKFAEIFDKYQKSGFPILACNSFIPGSLKSTGPDTKHDEIIEYARTAFERAQKTGIKYIVFGSSGSRNVPEGFDKDEARKQFIALLKRMGPVAKKYDVMVVIEPLNKKESNIINSVSEGVMIAKAVDRQYVKVLADFYHMAVEGEGPEAIIKAGKYLHHCHIAEKEGRTTPGIHGDDFTGYFKALKQIGYTGGISIEGRWKKEELAQSLAYLKKQIAIVNDSEI